MPLFIKCASVGILPQRNHLNLRSCYQALGCQILAFECCLVNFPSYSIPHLSIPHLSIYLSTSILDKVKE